MFIEHSLCARQCAQYFIGILSFNPHHNYEIGTIIISFTDEELEALGG